MYRKKSFFAGLYFDDNLFSYQQINKKVFAGIVTLYKIKAPSTGILQEYFSVEILLQKQIHKQIPRGMALVFYEHPGLPEKSGLQSFQIALFP